MCDARLLTARHDFISISQWWVFCIEDIIYRIYICWRMTVTQAGQAAQPGHLMWRRNSNRQTTAEPGATTAPQQQQQQQQQPHFLILSPSNFSLIRLARQEHRQTTATLNNNQQAETETGMEFKIFSMWSMAAGDTRARLQATRSLSSFIYRICTEISWNWMENYQPVNSYQL